MAAPLAPRTGQRFADGLSGSKVAGHRDLSPDLDNNGEVEPMEWTKQCPCFEVKKRSGNQEKGGDKA